MDDNRNDQIAAASWNGDALALPAADDATRTLERIGPLLKIASRQIGPAVDGAHELYAAVDELAAWEVRREAGRDGA